VIARRAAAREIVLHEAVEQALGRLNLLDPGKKVAR
jgi:hypothetical protein